MLFGSARRFVQQIQFYFQSSSHARTPLFGKFWIIYLFTLFTIFFIQMPWCFQPNWMPCVGPCLQIFFISGWLMMLCFSQNVFLLYRPNWNMHKIIHWRGTQKSEPINLSSNVTVVFTPLVCMICGVRFRFWTIVDKRTGLQL